MPDGRLTIRKASVKDTDALLAVEAACFARGPYRNHLFERAQYDYYVRNPGAIVLLATSAGESVGSLTATVGGGARSGTGRILSLGVVPQLRRQGIGRKILERGLKLLRERGCERIFLEVAAKEEPAVRLFESIGFKPKRHLSDYYGDGIDAIRMELNIA